MNLPNKLTVARFLLALAFVFLMSFRFAACHIVGFVVFTVAAITDHYDGKIARQRNLVTNFGKLMDPIADKVLLLGAFVMLMSFPGLYIPSWTVVVILAREFLITGARSLAASRGIVIPANVWGKTKAVIQMVYVFSVFLPLGIIGQLLQTFQGAAPWIPGVIGYFRPGLEHASLWAIVIVAVVTIYSGIQFMRVNWHLLGLGSEI